MLGEDDQLALTPVGVMHLRRVLQQFGQLLPLPVLPRVNDLPSLLFQRFEDDDFGFEFLNRLGTSACFSLRPVMPCWCSPTTSPASPVLQQMMQNAGVKFDTWDRMLDGALRPEVMKRYLEGWVFIAAQDSTPEQSLTEEEIDSLDQFLKAGGRLVLNGQDLAFSARQRLLAHPPQSQICPGRRQRACRFGRQRFRQPQCPDLWWSVPQPEMA